MKSKHKQRKYGLSIRTVAFLISFEQQNEWMAFSGTLQETFLMETWNKYIFVDIKDLFQYSLVFIKWFFIIRATST